MALHYKPPESTNSDGLKQNKKAPHYPKDRKGPLGNQTI